MGTAEVVKVQEASKEHKEFVSSLRELADFYEARPELQVPHEVCVNLWYQTPEEAQIVARLLGKVRKEVLGDSFFLLRRQFGPLKVEAIWNRDQVCERVVVGQETVEERVPATFTTQKVTRDKVEWRCPKITAPRLEGGE